MRSRRRFDIVELLAISGIVLFGTWGYHEHKQRKFEDFASGAIDGLPSRAQVWWQPLSENMEVVGHS